MAPPGYPKISVTPSRTRHSHRICEPVSFISISVYRSGFDPRSCLLFSLRVGPHPHALSLGGAASRRFPPAPRSGRRRFLFHPPVTAPSAADETSRAYFAMTPVVKRGG